MHHEWLAGRPNLDFTSVPAPLEWMPEPAPALGASVDALRAVADRVQPDVIHLNQFFYGAFALGAPTLVVAHSDVASWWRTVKSEDPPDDAWFQRYAGWVRAGLAGADLRVAPSAWMAVQAETIYDAFPVRVVHNGCSPGRFAPPAGAREPFVMAAGRLWDEAKGMQDLVAAAPGIPAPVRLAGPAEHPGGGAPFPDDTGVEYLGVLPAGELQQRLSRAAVYAATSRYEPFGLAPLEAALSGCALVMTDIPTFRELWEGCAVFYPPGDSSSLAAACTELLRQPNRRDALARAAAERARERYTPARMAAGYETFYHEMIG